MKRPKSSTLKVVQMREKFPHKDSPQSITLENEIKRVAKDRGESIELTIELLAKFSGITERQIYYYRSGKCDIPAGHIPIFCKQFGSNALAICILDQCEDGETVEDYDLIRLANRSARETLQVHDEFLEAFEDQRIDNFELTKLKKSKAKAFASMNRLEEIAVEKNSRHVA